MFSCCSTKAAGSAGVPQDTRVFNLKSKALVAQKAPYAVDVKTGDVKYWCTCGYSKTQPFCDGSHVQVNKDKSLNFAPMKWEAKKDETVYFCGCKQTNNPPMCDGAHAKLPADPAPAPAVAPATSSAAVYDLKSKALVVQKAPYAVDVKTGDVKYWCTCGYSKTQPFCDGSHKQVNQDKGLNFAPMKWEAKKDEKVYFCGCKQTNNPPMCDGAHVKIPDSAVYDLKSKALVAQKAPYAVDVKSGEVKYWCTCGYSKKQPFCDGSHVQVNKEKGLDFAPMKWEATKTETVYFCGCKQTNNPPMCDGAHAKLPDPPAPVYDLKTKALVAQKAPYAVDVKTGDVKYWCTCGYSKTQPFCDGSHVQVNKEKGLSFVPMKWEAKKTETVYFCGCKQTANPPMCDGAHAKI